MIRDETSKVQNVVLGRLGRAQTHGEEYACFPHTGKIDFSESEPTEPAFIENTFSAQNFLDSSEGHIFDPLG